jgi:hypothetical protein
MIWLNYKTCFLGVREARPPHAAVLQPDPWHRKAPRFPTHGTAQSQRPLYLRRAIASAGAIGSGPDGVAWFASRPRLSAM